MPTGRGEAPCTTQWSRGDVRAGGMKTNKISRKQRTLWQTTLKLQKGRKEKSPTEPPARFFSDPLAIAFSLCVCECACECVHVHVCAHVWVRVCTCVCARVCARTCVVERCTATAECSWGGEGRGGGGVRAGSPGTPEATQGARLPHSPAVLPTACEPHSHLPV